MSAPPAGWYPDPAMPQRHRYWDGARWTEHVGSSGADDELPVREILAEAGVQPTRAGDGTLFGEPVLVLHERPAAVGRGLQYDIVSPVGTVVGRWHELLERPDPDQTSLAELTAHYNTDQVALVGPDGQRWAQLAHKKVWKSTVTLSDPAGNEIGLLRQENVLGKVRLGLKAADHDIGEVVSDDTRLLGFTVTDAAGQPVGRVLKLGWYVEAGRVQSLGRYVLQLHSRPAQPLHALAVATPLAIDLAFAMTQAGQRSLGRVFEQT